VPGEDTPREGWRDRDTAALLRETKTAREAAGRLWPDTAARLGQLERALQAQQASAPEHGSPDGT
jgi:hypothetical protein